jgi:hypothetical protein
MPVDYIGKAERLTDLDLPRIGALIGVGEDEIHAVLDVESRGRGFDSHGRVIALFEPHIFYRELGPGSKRDQAVMRGLAYSKWGSKAYPKDSYPIFEQAITIDETAACRSMSWGLPQIMGFNASLAGYQSPQLMISAFADSEAAQLEAMIKFILSAGLDDELRAHNWRGFARGYNGAGYERHGYHTKLAAAYAKWSRIKDTPWTPAPPFQPEMMGRTCPCPMSE